MISAKIHPIQLVIFDWDGTLMDSVPRIISCMQQMAKATGLTIPSESAIRDIIGLSLWIALERLFQCDDPEEQKHLIAIYREFYVNKDQTPSPLFPGVREVLCDLKSADFKLAVATGKARQGLERAWLQTDSGHFFSASCCADEAASKPNPDMLNRILSQTGIPAERALMIGDSQYDLQMAAQARMESVAVTWGAHSLEQLQQEKPMAAFSTLDALPAWLRQINTMLTEHTD